MSNNHTCKFNKAIDCTEQKCEKCGWNPEVTEKRIEKLVNKFESKEQTSNTVNDT